MNMRFIDDGEMAMEELSNVGESSPEEYVRLHMNPNREMVEVYEESDGKWYTVPAFETGVEVGTKSDEEIAAEANNWKVTAGIIAAILVFIALVFWLCFTLIA